VTENSEIREVSLSRDQRPAPKPSFTANTCSAGLREFEQNLTLDCVCRNVTNYGDTIETAGIRGSVVGIHSSLHAARYATPEHSANDAPEPPSCSARRPEWDGSRVHEGSPKTNVV